LRIGSLGAGLVWETVRAFAPWPRLGLRVSEFANRVCIGMRAELKLPRVADAELELARAAVVDVMVNGNAVVEAQRADGQVEAQAETPVVIKVLLAEVIRLGGDVADIIEQSEAQPFDDRNAVFGGAEPVGIATDGFRIARFTGANTAVFEAAHGIKAAEIIALVEGNITGFEAIGNTGAPDEFENVAGKEAFEVPGGLEFEFVKLLIAPRPVKEALNSVRWPLLGSSTLLRVS